MAESNQNNSVNLIIAGGMFLVLLLIVYMIWTKMSATSTANNGTGGTQSKTGALGGFQDLLTKLQSGLGSAGQGIKSAVQQATQGKSGGASGGGSTGSGGGSTGSGGGNQGGNNGNSQTQNAGQDAYTSTPPGSLDNGDGTFTDKNGDVYDYATGTLQGNVNDPNSPEYDPNNQMFASAENVSDPNSPAYDQSSPLYDASLDDSSSGYIEPDAVAQSPEPDPNPDPSGGTGDFSG